MGVHARLRVSVAAILLALIAAPAYAGDRSVSMAQFADDDPPTTTIIDWHVDGATFTVWFEGERAATFTCEIVDVVTREDCSSPATFTELPDGTHTLRVVARDLAGNADATPATLHVMIDREPETTIESGPDERSPSSDATFTFSSESEATYECRLDDGGWAVCSSPYTLRGLADGSHTFAVRAIHRGVADPTPAVSTWEVDTTPPETTIDSMHPYADGWRFEVSSSDPGTSLRCKVDFYATRECSSPIIVGGLWRGNHVLLVWSYDNLGREEQTPARAEFATGGFTLEGFSPPLLPPATGGAPAPAPVPDPAIPADRPYANVPKRLTSALGSLLARTTAKALAKRKAITVRQAAPEAGQARIRVNAKVSGRTVTVGKADARWTRSATKAVRVRLTAGGRALLRGSARVRIRLVASFTPDAAGAAARSTARLTLRRSKSAE